jgi:alanine racemase
MDQVVVDVSAASEVTAGDEAVLIGRQGEDEVAASELANWCGTIPWEILTGISYRVPRVYRGAQAS